MTNTDFDRYISSRYKLQHSALQGFQPLTNRYLQTLAHKMKRVLPVLAICKTTYSDVDRNSGK